MTWFGPHICGEENHRFEPRYDSEPAADLKVGAPISTITKLAEMTQKRTYVCDVCTRCGVTVRRSFLADVFGEFDTASKREDPVGR